MDLIPTLHASFPLSQVPAPAYRALEASRGEGWFVACSGGADSTFLAYWLRAHFPDAASRMTLVHFNHKTRKDESDEDARAVARLSEQLACGFVEGWRNEGEAGESEDTLRRARFECIEEKMREAGVRTLILGHNREDVTETLWMRLSRGSGVEGLSAPRPLSMHREGWEHDRVRPLLGFSGQALRACLDGAGIPWREDSTNRDERYVRNYIRQQVLPVWETYCDRNVHVGAARSRYLLEEASDVVAGWAVELYPEGWETGHLDLAPLRGKPRGLGRYVILRWLGRAGQNLSPVLCDAVLDAVTNEESGEWTIGTGLQLVGTTAQLQLRRAESGDAAGGAWEAAVLVPGQSLYLPDGGRLSFFRVEDKERLMERIPGGGVNPAAEAFIQLKEPVVCRVRLRRNGDQYRPLGAPGTRKLQDCFIDRKIPVEERARLPLVCHASGEILWVPGFPPADRYRVQSDGESVLGLTYTCS